MHLQRHIIRALALATALCAAPPVDARLTRLEVTQREVVAGENGQPIMERILTEFGDRNFNGGSPTTLPLSGGTAFRSFPLASTDKAMAQAELRITPSDSPRPSGPDIPRGSRVADDQWAFASCPEGWPGTPSAGDICVKDDFQNNLNYRLIYGTLVAPERLAFPSIPGVTFALEKQRLMLTEDVELTVREANERDVLR
jgi:hypothetical protein